MTVKVLCVPSSARTIFRIFMWLPFWETKENLLASKIARTSTPERERKLGTKPPIPTASRERLAPNAGQFPRASHLQEIVRAPRANSRALLLRLRLAKRCPIRDTAQSNQIRHRAWCRVESREKVSWQNRVHPRARGEHGELLSEPRFIPAHAGNIPDLYHRTRGRHRKIYHQFGRLPNNHDKIRLTEHQLPMKLVV